MADEERGQVIAPSLQKVYGPNPTTSLLKGTKFLNGSGPANRSRFRDFSMGVMPLLCRDVSYY